jgi:hypothetical protein
LGRWAVCRFGREHAELSNYMNQPDGYPSAWPRKRMLRKTGRIEVAVEQKATFLDVLLHRR